MRGRVLVPALGVLAVSAGCLEGRSALDTSPAVDAGSDAGPEVDAGPPPALVSDQVDLLFVVDNSPDTDAVHTLLAGTVPYLLGRLARPACVNGLGNVVATTPAPTDPCPDGQREFPPVTDMHVGVISTSLGRPRGRPLQPREPRVGPDAGRRGSPAHARGGGQRGPDLRGRGLPRLGPGPAGEPARRRRSRGAHDEPRRPDRGGGRPGLRLRSRSSRACTASSSTRIPTRASPS